MPADFSKLLISCPHCQKVITFNDFITDIEIKLAKLPVGTRRLTKLERIVIIQTVKGNSVKVIGQQLNRSSKTIEVHRYNAYEKLGVHNSHELMFALIVLVSNIVIASSL